MSGLDKKEIRSDVWLQRLMKTGLPLGAVSVGALWLGWYFSDPALGSVFIVTAALAIAIGLIYNIRFVMLSVRQLRKKNAEAEKESKS